MTDLMVLPSDKNGLEQVFIEGQDIDSTITKIREEAKNLPTDMSVRKNREEVASFAHKVARLKTAVDKAGMALSAEYKEIPKKIDANRRVYKDAFESLQAEVRQPLNEWEQAEADRKLVHERALEKINLRADECHQLDASEARFNIQWLENDVVINDSWEEYELEAGRAKDRALKALREHLAAVEAREAEQAELERLRKEAAERERVEREERIAREAAEKARQEQAEALAKAQAEKELAEQRRIAAEKQAELDRIEAEKRAEQERIDAEQRAAEQAEAAAQAERDRIAAEQAQADAERKAREADKEHQGNINRAAMEAIQQTAGLTDEQARAVIVAIIKGEVPSVTINY